MTPQEWLVRRYKKSLKELLRRIAAKQAAGRWTGYERQLLQEIEKAVRELDTAAAEEMADLVKKAYIAAEEQAVSTLSRSGITPLLSGGLNREAMWLVAENAVDTMVEANHYFGRHLQDKIRRIGLEAIGEKLSTGQTVREAARRILDMLNKDGFEIVMGAKGRQMQLDTYAELVSRTTTREATNTATSETCRQWGHDLVKFTTHYPTCAVCAPLQGRVFSISGKDKRFPALSSVPGFDQGFKTIHPNCRHVLVPTIEALWTDEERERYLADAKKPIRGDTREQAEVDRYNAIQKEKRDRWRDRRQWNAYKELYPDYCQKNLSTFRQDKARGGNRYLTMLKARRLNGIPKDAIIIPNSVGAKAKDIYVSFDLDGKKIKVPLEPGSQIQKVVVFAGQGTDREIRERYRLEGLTGASADGWRKISGEAFVIVNGKHQRIEIHWYEHDDVGAMFHKAKKVFDDESKKD